MAHEEVAVTVHFVAGPALPLTMSPDAAREFEDTLRSIWVDPSALIDIEGKATRTGHNLDVDNVSRQRFVVAARSISHIEVVERSFEPKNGR